MTGLPHAFRYRALTPEQCQSIAAALEAGATAEQLARQYGVTTRTIYRAKERAAEQVVELHVGEWRATFAIGDAGPTQITPWLPA